MHKLKYAELCPMNPDGDFVTVDDKQKKHGVPSAWLRALSPATSIQWEAWRSSTIEGDALRHGTRESENPSCTNDW